MALVIDCSVAMAWCFEDESSPVAEAALDLVVAEGGIAPSLWPFEVTNALLMAERRKRGAAADSRRALALLRGLGIRIDRSESESWSEAVLALARQTALSAYDAAYLDLAMRSGQPLATLDKQLSKACAAVGSSVFSIG